ncbi:MAG: SBBP repeat-containing protein, partial [Elusimicrobia bacterium]|nr:SBBP repeat-containing protein [Elusimicrobiota bacterium]
QPSTSRLAVNPVSHDLYLVASSSYTKILVVRYSDALAELGSAEFQSANYAQGADVKLDSAGNVYVVGAYNSGASDYPVLLKYSPALVFQSSAASMQTYGYEPAGLALDPATGDAYVTGPYFSTGNGFDTSTWDMRTVKVSTGAGAPPAGTQRVWIGGGSDLASEAGNWQPNGVPQPGDGILFDAAYIPNANLNWDLGPSVPLSSITIQGVLPSGAFIVASPLLVFGDIILNSPNTTVLFGAAASGSQLAGPVTVDAGIFSVNASTLVAVGSITVNGGTFDLASAFFMGTKVDVGSGGTFLLRVADPGFNDAPPLLTSTGPLGGLRLDLAGAVDISSCVLGRLWDKGLRIGLTYSFADFSNVLFVGPLLPGTTAIDLAGGTPSADFNNVNFLSGDIAVNVNASLLSPGANINMLGATGPKAGAAFENDPGGYVQWGPVGAGFTGDFSQAAGAVYDGGSLDYPRGVAVDTFTADGPYVYVVGTSSKGVNSEILVIKYDPAGNTLSSTTWPVNGTDSISGFVAVNPNGVYVSAQESGVGYLTIKYDKDLVFLSSASLAGNSSNEAIALDNAGNVFVTGGYGDFRTVKYDRDLNQQGAPAVFNSVSEALDLDLDAAGNVYVIGYSTWNGATEYIAVKYSNSLVFLASAAYTGDAYVDSPSSLGLAVNKTTGFVYVAGTSSTTERDILTLKYDSDLNYVDSVVFGGGLVGARVAVGSDDNVYVLGSYATANDHWVLLQYSPVLAFISSQTFATAASDEPSDLALDASDKVYATGITLNAGDLGSADFATKSFTFASGPALVYVSSADVSPGFFMAGQEDAALKIIPYTLSGSAFLTGLQVAINPAGDYANITSVSLYDDTDGNGIWNSQADTLLSSGAVISASHYFDLTGLGVVINTQQEALLLTLTPAVAAVSSNVNVAVLSSASFITDGAMAQQAIYPIVSAPTPVNYLAAVTDLAIDPGAGLNSVGLDWNYPQNITSGHYIVRYSTNPADLSDPNAAVNQTITPISGITAGDPEGHSLYSLSPVINGLRLYPYYFAVWLFNGSSTSTVSNVVRNLYFPAASLADQDATLDTRVEMIAVPDKGAKVARSAAGSYSALTFYGDGSYIIALNMPDGSSSFYYDPVNYLVLKDLAADQDGNTYGFIQKSNDTPLVAKFGPDGAVLWTRTFITGSTETAKALVYGNNAVYAATEYENGSDGLDFKLRKLSAADGTGSLEAAYGSSPGNYSPDEVNGLAFFEDNTGKFIYAAGASGQYPQSARLHKYEDNGAALGIAAGTWPAAYSNPGGGDSSALAVKADLIGNTLVAGSEQRYDLNQGLNIWVNRYSPFGASLFASPARYNNAQSNSDDNPTGLDLDGFGNIYVSGYTDMWNLGQGSNMLLAKFSPGGQFLSARIYDSGSGNYDLGLGVLVSTDNYARVAGMFGSYNYFGFYSLPLGSANAQFFTASEGPFTGSADLMWNYAGALPAGSTYYVQYSADPAPVWNLASAQLKGNPGAQAPGSIQSHRVGALPVIRYPGSGGATEGQETRGNLYKFKVWITSAGLTTELPEAQSFAKTPSAYDNTQYYGRERLSYMSGQSGPGSAIAVDSPYVYQAFGGSADGASAGFGLRKYNTDQYLEWTRFFNHKLNRGYRVGGMTRDAAGNFYLVGSQGAVFFTPEYESVKNSWIAKLDPAGDLVWSYADDASGIGMMDELHDVAVEGNSLYVAGVSSTASNGMDTLVRKYDISPSTYPALQQHYLGGASGDDAYYGIDVGTGAVYLAGTVVNADKDIILEARSKADLSAVGDPIVFDSGFGDDEGFDLALTTTTPVSVYVAGLAATAGTSGEGANAALFKYTLDGTLAWDDQFNGRASLDDAFSAVKVNGSGVLVAGYEETAGQGRDAVYFKFDQAGEELWNRGFNFSYGGDDDVYSLDLDASGRVYSAVSLWDNNPGFYYFPEPSFGITADKYHVPGSVQLDWMSQYAVPSGSPFAIQYSTYDLGVAWSTAAAQVWFTLQQTIWEGMNVNRAVYGLDSGRDAQGGSLGAQYYFKVWFSTEAGSFTAVPGAAASRASEGWSNENVVMYPNEARLFVMNSGQQSAAYYYGEKELPGIARDASGNIYTLANMDWNGNGGFAVKKFSSSYAPVSTRYYAPGEWFYVKANRLAVDANGALYITGSERDPYGSTGRDLFVMKFGDSGVVWKSTYNFAGGDDAGYGVTLDASGNVYVAGSADAGGGDLDILAAKFSPAGALLSTVTYSGTASYGTEAGYGIALHGTNVYVAGSSLEPGEGPSLWLGSYSAASLAAQGAPLKRSSDSASGYYEEAAYDVAVDSNGYVYTAGALYNADSYSLDAVVLKSSADLTAAGWGGGAWYGSQAGGADAAYGLVIGGGTGGNIYVAGSTERYDINQDKNLWLRKYAQDDASELWTQEFNSSALPGDYSGGPNSDEGFGVATAGGNVAVSGKFNGYYGLYKYKQSSTLNVNPTLTVVVSSAACAGCASAPFPGVGVALIPYSQTGGIDASSIRSSITSPSGTASFQVPAGKQYFIGLDKQGYNPNIKDQQMDPYGNFFVQLDADIVKQYTLRPRPAGDPYYPLTVTVTSAAAGDFVMAEVFFTQTGEKAAYGLAQVPVNRSSVTFTVANVPPMVAGAYTLGLTLPNRGVSRGVIMDALFPATSSYAVNMSTSGGAVATTGGFDVGASTTPASVEGVVRNAATRAPLQEVRVRMWNPPASCSPGSPCTDYNVYETLTDVNGKFSFYNVLSTAAPYNLAAQKSGYKRAGWGVDLSVPNSPTVYREFQLDEATYTLRGVIRYRDVPVPNADVMVWGDYNWYNGSDSYRGGRGMDTDARTKTAADGSFLFSTATLNGLPDGQLRMNVAFFGNWVDLNEGNNKSNSIDADDVRIVISSAGATGLGNCTKGKVWKLLASGGACQSAGSVNFNIMPQGQNDYAALRGSVTFITTYTVTAANPLVISSVTPVTVMAMQECGGDCQNRSLGFAVLSGTYTVNAATYSITLSTGVTYFTRITSSEWGEVSSFDDRANFKSSATTSVIMNFTVTRAGSLKGVVKMPDGSNYKPSYGDGPQNHKIDIEVRGQNVNVSEGWNVDDYGSFEFPNLAPGLYTITMRPEGMGFRWAAPALADVAVVAGKTTQVALKLEDGLVVQPQIIGLPELSTPAWSYVMIPVESGTEMNQKKVTELFFGKSTFAFNYSTVTRTWDKKVMLMGQYDFYLMMGARYNPEGSDGTDPSYDQFGNFIGKVKGLAVQRVESAPNLGTEAQPIPVNVLGSLGQESFGGTILGERIFTDSDLEKIFSNMDGLFALIPAVMVYDAAGDLRGYTAGLPTGDDFAGFIEALQTKDKDIVKAYFAAHSSRFMVSGLPPGRYTVIFSNPNYPPIAKELDIPLAAAYPFNFDQQVVRTGDIFGTVRSTVPVAGAYPPLADAVVYLKHRTVEKFTNTAADGTYSFSSLPPGIFRLEVTREGYVKTGQKTSLTGSLTGDDESEQNFYLTPSQSNMTGKVYLSKFPATLTKSGVKLVAYDETFNTEHPSDYLPKLEATTNDAGEYELAGVVPGHTYKVSAFYGSKLPATLDVPGETVTEGVTYLPDIVLREVPPQITVKARKSPDSANKVDVTIKSPKKLVSTPVCKVNPGSTYIPGSAVSLALVPGPNHTYLGQFTVSKSQAFYNVYVAAGDGSNKMEKSVTYSPNNQAKTEQYIQSEAIQGGEVQMDKETEEYSGIELDAGGLSYSTSSASTDVSNLVGGFFSALPSVRTVKTAKGDLSLTQAIQDLMASEVYNMELENASANKPFTLTLKYDKDKAAGNGDLRIYQYDDATGAWKEVPGDYTVDPMLGVLSVGVAGLTEAHAGTSGVNTPLGRKRFGMSAVVNGRYVPSAAGTSQSGRFAVFTANPPTGTAAFSSALEVYNLPNPFNLKSKNVALSADLGASGIANPYPTNGTVIKYNLPAGKTGRLKFVIYNTAGEKVRTIDEGSRTGGQLYYSEWDGRNDNNQPCASGVYFMLTYVDGKKLGNKAHKMAIIK